MGNVARGPRVREEGGIPVKRIFNFMKPAILLDSPSTEGTRWCLKAKRSLQAEQNLTERSIPEDTGQMTRFRGGGREADFAGDALRNKGWQGEGGGADLSVYIEKARGRTWGRSNTRKSLQVQNPSENETGLDPAPGGVDAVDDGTRWAKKNGNPPISETPFRKPDPAKS